MSSHVFKEAEPGLHFSDDVPDIRPEVSGIVLPFSTARGGEWLARVAASDAIHNATPRLAVEGFEVSPDWCIVKNTVANTGECDSERIGFPLHVTDCASAGFGKSQPKLDSPDSGTYSQDIHGATFTTSRRLPVLPTRCVAATVPSRRLICS